MYRASFRWASCGICLLVKKAIVISLQRKPTAASAPPSLNENHWYSGPDFAEPVREIHFAPPWALL